MVVAVAAAAAAAAAAAVAAVAAAAAAAAGEAVSGDVVGTWTALGAWLQLPGRCDGLHSGFFLRKVQQFSRR